MKFLLFALLLGFAPAPPIRLLLIDMDGKRPLQTASAFSMSEYVTRSFPIYASDLPSIIEATEKAAHLLDGKPACGRTDTLQAAHTRIIVKMPCENGRSATVRYITQIDELHFLCDFELIRGEPDLRKAQRKLLDYSAYLSK